VPPLVSPFDVVEPFWSPVVTFGGRATSPVRTGSRDSAAGTLPLEVEFSSDCADVDVLAVSSVDDFVESVVDCFVSVAALVVVGKVVSVVAVASVADVLASALAVDAGVVAVSVG
jgi:hypothetical protein